MTTRHADPARKVSLRAETDGADQRFLWARLNADGALVIEGQDLGPMTAIISSDGEYEWSHAISPEHRPALLALLDAPPTSDILDVLERGWTDPRAGELERRIREGDIPSKLWTWNG